MRFSKLKLPPLSAMCIAGVASAWVLELALDSLEISSKLYWKNQYFPSDVNPNSSTICRTVQKGIFSGKIGLNCGPNGVPVTWAVCVHRISSRITVWSGGNGESCQWKYVPAVFLWIINSGPQCQQIVGVLDSMQEFLLRVAGILWWNWVKRWQTDISVSV